MLPWPARQNGHHQHPHPAPAPIKCCRATRAASGQKGRALHISRHESGPCQAPRVGEGSTRAPGDVWRERGLSGRSRLGRRPPLPPDQPVDPRVGDLAVHDAVFPQRPFTHEPELLQHASRCHVACIGLSLDAIQVQRVECPPQQGARGLRRVAVAPRCIVEAVAQRCTAVVRIPPVQAAPADERRVGDTIHGQPRPGALLCHLPASRDEPLGAHAFAPRRRVPVAQHVGVAVQREQVVRIRVVEGAQSKAIGVQRGGWAATCASCFLP